MSFALSESLELDCPQSVPVPAIVRLNTDVIEDQFPQLIERRSTPRDAGLDAAPSPRFRGSVSLPGFSLACKRTLTALSDS